MTRERRALPTAAAVDAEPLRSRIRSQAGGPSLWPSRRYAVERGLDDANPTVGLAAACVTRRLLFQRSTKRRDAKSRRAPGDPKIAQFDGETFYAISGTAEDDIWVLGIAADRRNSGRPLMTLNCPIDRSADAFVRHYDGATWKRTDGIAKKQVLDLWAGSRSDVWVVGSDGVVAHYDGTAWTASDVRQVAGVDLSQPCNEVSLHAVWGSSSRDVWAVGYASFSAAGSALVLHYDGSTWTRAPVTDRDGLLDVWGTSASDVWVVGASGITHHFDGATWSKVDGGTNLYRYGVWGAASSDVWSVGIFGEISRFDGTRWTLVRGRGGEQFEAVWGAHTNDVWTVGTGIRPARIYGGPPRLGPPPVPIALHWDGKVWSERTTNAHAPFSDVWVSNAGHAWAVAADEIVRLVP